MANYQFIRPTRLDQMQRSLSWLYWARNAVWTATVIVFVAMVPIGAEAVIPGIIIILILRAIAKALTNQSWRRCGGGRR
jgi:hypothetical protein